MFTRPEKKRDFRQSVPVNNTHNKLLFLLIDFTCFVLLFLERIFILAKKF